MAYDLQLFTNNAVTLLASPISASDTSFTVMTGYGSLFPNPTVGQYFLVTLENQTGTAREIIRVDARVGDTFTSIQRAQEGTPATAWSASSGNDTLVDHRVTAETMRLAMLLPETTGPSGITGIQVLKDGVQVGAEGTALNFAGDVTITGAGPTKTITVTGSSSINGESVPLVSIDPGWTLAGSSSTYSENQRGFKFFVTITMPVNHKSTSFEVLGNISGDLGANAETAVYNRTSRVGYNFLGAVDIVLDKTVKTIELVWTNGEANPVTIQCVRIQHNP